MLSNNIQSVTIEVVGNISNVPSALSVVVVLNPGKDINFIVDLVPEEEVGLGQNLVADVEYDHVSEGEILLSNDCSVVPGKIVLIFLKINSDSVVRVALITEVLGTDTETCV